MNVNYTVDLDEYETLFELQRLHCGPSLCLRRINDGFLINLVVLSNIAFSESSFQVFLEEIDRISRLPPHPSIVRFIGLSKPNPNFYNSIGIAYEFCPKCFSLACIIEDIASPFSIKTKVDYFSSTFGHNCVLSQNPQNKDDIKDLNKNIDNNNNINNEEINKRDILIGDHTNNVENSISLQPDIQNDNNNLKENNVKVDDINNAQSNINESNIDNTQSADNNSSFNNNNNDDKDASINDNLNFDNNDNDIKFDNNVNSNNDGNTQGLDLNFDNNTNNKIPFDNNSSELKFDNNINNNDSNISINNNNNSSEINFNNNSSEIPFDNNQDSKSSDLKFGNNINNNDSNLSIDNNNNSSEVNFNNNSVDLNLDNINNNDSELNLDNKQITDEKNDQDKVDTNDKLKETELINNDDDNDKQSKSTKKKVVENEPPLSNEQTLIVLYGITNALSFLHQHDITFMNMNVSNILLDENLEPKIQYYGISSLFEYFSVCCCNLNGNNIFLNPINKITMVNNYIISYNSIVRSISTNDISDYNGIRIVKNRSLNNVQNREYCYLIRNLADSYTNPNDTTKYDKNKKTVSFLDRNLKDLIFVSPEVLYGHIPDKKNDVYAFAYLLYFFCAQERAKWILNFDASYINKIIQGNRLVVKATVPILIKMMISKCWDATANYRPFYSEINWWVSELGQFFFVNEFMNHPKIIKMPKFEEYKEKLPKIKREKNTFLLQKNAKMLYDAAKQLPISSYGQNYARSVIRLQSLLMDLRNSNLFETLDAIVMNEQINNNDNKIENNDTNESKNFTKMKKLLKSKGKFKFMKKQRQNNIDNDNDNDNNNNNSSNENLNENNNDNNEDDINSIPNKSFSFNALSDLDFDMKIFNQLYFVQTKDGVYSLALNIAVACKSRFTKILCYARLVSELYHGYSSKYPHLAKLKKYLLSFCLTSLANYCAYPNALPLVALIFYCLQLHVYDTEEMVDTIGIFYEKYKTEKKISISILFCWFCPEIESSSIELFEKMHNLVKTQCQYDYFPYAFKNFIKQMDKYRENNWSFYHNLRFDKDLTDSIAYALRNDDLKAFQKIFLENKKALNAKIDPDIFIPCTYVHNYPTAIMYAALFGSIRCFFFLLRNGARPGSWDRKYRLLPSYSIAGGNETIFLHCLQSNKEDDSLMQTAAQFHWNFLFYKSFLIDKSLLTSMDKFGKSVMTAAAESNNVSILIFSFVQKSCQENFVESFGRTPLHVAAEQEMIDVLRVLLFLANDEVMHSTNLSNSSSAANGLAVSESDADLNESDVNLNTNSKPLKKFGSKITSKIKSKFGHITNLPNSNFESENVNDTQKNVQNQAKKEVRIVDVNARDSWGMTPLHLAADKMKKKSVEILFTSPNIDVNIKNSSGKTAVYYAVKTGDLKLIKLFLNNPKVDFCCQTKKGETPLHTAVKMGRPDIVKLIIDKKPDLLFIPDSQNMSPYEMASATKETEVAQIFHEFIIKRYQENAARKAETTANIAEESNEQQENHNSDAITNNDDKIENDNNDNDNNNNDGGENSIHDAAAEGGDSDVVTSPDVVDGSDQKISDEFPFDGEAGNDYKRKKKKKKNDEDCVIF